VSSLESLRRLNRLRVIHALRAEGLISRADIARATGLSRSTVSSLITDLQADGLVVETGAPGAARGAQGGRPPILLAFEPAAGAAVGIDFGHSHLRVAVSDLSSSILAERSVALDTDHEAREGLDAAAGLVSDTLAEAGVARERVIGAGLGLPGPVHQGSGFVESPAILPGWAGIEAAAEMRERLDIPVLVDNDANLGALAEAAFGAARSAGDLVYLKVSSGIGAGLILDGRLYRGALGVAGELGHVVVEPGGMQCRCGNRGCLETVANTRALLPGRSPRDVLAGAHAGDPECRAAIARAGDAIGRATAMLLNVLNPQLVVVGGELAGAGDLLLDGVRARVGAEALPAAAETARVVAGVLGDRAQVLGAIALVVSEADRALPARVAAAAPA
jgi:predicted NBD/HSP70 family sugar kinase